MTSKVTVKENKPVHGKNRHPAEHRDEEISPPTCRRRPPEHLYFPREFGQQSR